MMLHHFPGLIMYYLRYLFASCRDPCCFITTLLDVIWASEENASDMHHTQLFKSNTETHLATEITKIL